MSSLAGVPTTGQGSSLPDNVPTDDAVVWPPSGDYLDCPAPRPEAAPGVASGWARNPATGECCPYANRDAAPDGWLRFDSDIECRCSTESCPSTIHSGICDYEPVVECQVCGDDPATDFPSCQ